MGPRPDGRGKADPFRVKSAASCVNGAAARRPRKDQAPVCGTYAPEASMGPRPDGRGKRHLLIRRLVRPIASMGPRPDGRGKTRPRPDRRSGLCVNGAAARRPRKDDRPAPAASACRSVNGAAARRPRIAPPPPPIKPLQRASMGPRPDGRGKPGGALGYDYRTQRQWGRGQTAAEST